MAFSVGALPPEHIQVPAGLHQHLISVSEGKAEPLWNVDFPTENADKSFHSPWWGQEVTQDSLILLTDEHHVSPFQGLGPQILSAGTQSSSEESLSRAGVALRESMLSTRAWGVASSGEGLADLHLGSGYPTQPCTTVRGLGPIQDCNVPSVEPGSFPPLPV